ncbi:hypothetical protein PDIG_50380 [Penicillium digitatum PHI26]|uniref:Uncharacterized protein n=2 Tax=Penicillium digitatum TaxID=36651 RepID=K9GDT0_PEND2|nr:hypothetical protein PDIP_19620 [Penicillium digitatum Pd1]EKV11401.1 hypothetical protein PDIG_50380 [Penicillium digitatum PHI26]EKV20119.1 hypothetical protein PDIP_19620 [Penicillium digitatum Pd1]
MTRTIFLATSNVGPLIASDGIVRNDSRSYTLESTSDFTFEINQKNFAPHSQNPAPPRASIRPSSDNVCARMVRH